MNNVNHRLLVSIVALQVLTLASQWTGSSSSTANAARGEIPDPGARQMQMVDELKQMNAKLDRLVGVLEGGKLQVTTVSADPKK